MLFRPQKRSINLDEEINIIIKTHIRNYKYTHLHTYVHISELLSCLQQQVCQRSTAQKYHKQIIFVCTKHTNNEKKTHYKYLFKRDEEEREDVLNTNIYNMNIL